MIVTVIKQSESVIYNGKIYSCGQSFDVDDLIGKSLMERGYVSVNGESPVTEEETKKESCLQEVPYTELKKLAASLGLPANGKKEELIERISAVENESESGTDELPNTDMPE